MLQMNGLVYMQISSVGGVSYQIEYNVMLEIQLKQKFNIRMYFHFHNVYKCAT